MQWIETLNENTFSLPRLSLRMRKMDISIDTYPDLRHLYAHFCSGAQIVFSRSTFYLDIRHL